MLTESLNFTEPSIVTTDDLSHRSFISFSINNKPQRLYHGKNIGEEINPNRAKSIDERNRLLAKLHFELKKALELNNFNALFHNDLFYCIAISGLDISAKGKAFPLMHRQIMMFKAGLRGTHHHCTHLQKYIDEFSYRFNRLKYQDTLFNRLIERMVFSQPLFYQKYYCY